MYRSVVLSVAVLLVALQFVYGDEEGTFDVITGNCSQALARDMVYREHVHKYFIPLVERNATSSWFGDEKIYCVKALNENDVSDGGIAFIKDGGLSHRYVTVEMHSKRGNSLNYDVQIYAK